MVTNTGGPPAGVSSDGTDPRTQLPIEHVIGNNTTFVTSTSNSSALEDISRQIDEILAERKNLTDYLLSLEVSIHLTSSVGILHTSIFTNPLTGRF